MKKILCWGTGKKANDFIKAVKNYLDDSFIILAFIDNNENKVGQLFDKYPIISPDDINLYDYDILLILNTFEDEIRAQIKEMNVQSSYILNFNEFCDLYIKELWLDKDVVFVGDRYSFEYYEFLIKYTFKSYCYLEKYNEETIGDRVAFICAPRHIAPEDKVKFQDEIINKSKKNIYREEEFTWFVNADKKLSFGNKNEDKIFYILHGQDPKSGLGNIIIRVLKGINYSYKKGWIPVIDLKNIKNQYITNEQYGKKNAWDLFFKSINNYTLDDVYSSKNVILSSNVDYDCAPGSSYDIELNDDISELVEAEYKRLFPCEEKVLGAVYRGTDYYSAYNHPAPESIDEFEIKIKDEMKEKGYNYVFLATEIQEVVDELKKRFGDKLLCTNQKRYSINERRFLADIHFERENDEYLKGVEYLIVLELLAKCDSIIGKTNATIIASGLIRKRTGAFKLIKSKNEEDLKIYKKKILIITSCLGFNGASYAALYLGKALKNKDYYVCLATDTKCDYHFIEEISKNGIDSIIIEALPYIGKNDLDYIKKYDLVITNVFQSIYSTFICSKQLPVLWWVHENADFKYSSIFGDTRKKYKQIDYSKWMKSIKIAAVSEIAKEAFEEIYDKKIEYILPFGIPDRSIKQEKEKSKIVFAVIGSVNYRKGIDIFVDAAIKLNASSDVEFWIIGDVEKDSSIYKYIVEKTKANANIIIWGEKNTSEMEELYSQIDVVVCSSRVETMSMTVVEGLMYGKPCITTDTTGISRYISNHENGIVIRSENVEDLADAMLWIVENKANLNGLKTEARRAYEKYFTMEIFAESAEKIVEKTINDFGRI